VNLPDLKDSITRLGDLISFQKLEKHFYFRYHRNIQHFNRRFFNFWFGANGGQLVSRSLNQVEAVYIAQE